MLGTGEGQGEVLTAAEDLFLKGMEFFTEHRSSTLQLFKTSCLLSAPRGFMFQHHIVNRTYLQLQLNSRTQYCKRSHPLKPRNIKVFQGTSTFLFLFDHPCSLSTPKNLGLVSNYDIVMEASGVDSVIQNCFHGGHVECGQILSFQKAFALDCRLLQSCTSMCLILKSKVCV